MTFKKVTLVLVLFGRYFTYFLLDETILKGPNSTIAATAGTIASVGVLGKLAFTPPTRHRLFFAKAPPNSNIRIETLKMGMELLVRSGIVFYGGATGGAIAGRVLSKSPKQ